MTTTQSMKDAGQQTAATAADESKKVADTARTEVQNVAADAKAHASGLLDEAITQVNDQSRTQRDRLVRTLQTFGDDLEQMASQGGRSGLATDLARQVADRSRSISTRMDGREPTDLLDDVRDFARRRPGTFLAGALAAGVVAGRFARGARAASGGGPESGASVPVSPAPVPTPVPPAPVFPVAGQAVAPSYGQEEIRTPAPPVVPGGTHVTGNPLTDPLGDPLGHPLGDGHAGRTAP